MPESKAQTSFSKFTESLKSKKLSPVNPSSITGRRPIRLSGDIVSKKETQELGSIRKLLGNILALDKRYYQFLGDRILEYTRGEEKKKLQDEELRQEQKKGKKGNKGKVENPIVEKAKFELSKIGQFFMNLTKFFVGYKVLEWAANPRNTKKIQDFVNLFTKIFKFINGVVGFGIDVLMKTFTIVSKTINGVFDFIGAIGEFLTFRWVGGGIEWLLKTVENITSIFASIPNAITLAVDFLTKLVPNFLESVFTGAITDSEKDLKTQADQAIEAKSPAETPDTSSPADTSSETDLGEKAKQSLSNIGKNILKTLFPGMDIATNIGAKIGGSIKALFTGDKSQEPLPKLAKGGIVTKPTEAIVGEAGPEAILPLDKLGSFGIDGFKASTNKMIPKFMELMTVPFKIIGAGIVALITSTVGKIPGIGQFIVPLISALGNSFGLPASILSGVDRFTKDITSGATDLASLLGKESTQLNAQKGQDFTPSNDTTVKGLLNNILGALVSKQEKTQTPAPTPKKPPTTPPAPTGSPDPSGSPSEPSTTPVATPATPTVSNLFKFPEKKDPHGEGYISGGEIGDKVPALLEQQEYVLNRNAVKGMGGPKVLDAINYGMYPRFGSGGPNVSTKKFLKLGSGWAPVPEDSSGVVLGRRMSGKHGGTDIPMPVGTPLLSPFDGTVKETGRNPGGWGNFMVLRSSNGLYSLFGHVSEYVKNQGDRVKAGEQVALSGHQHGGGRSSGPHLHWEIGSSWNGTIGGKVDPISWSSGKAVPSVSGQTSSTASTDVKDSTTTPEPVFNPKEIAKNLASLYKMLNPSTTPPETVQLQQPQTPKITSSVSQSSGTLQRVQKENIKLQSESRGKPKSSGNVITLGQPNKTISEVTSQPMTPSLGGTTPPNYLINYPIAP